MKNKLGINIILLGTIVILLISILIFKYPTQYVSAQGDGSAKHVFGLIGKRQGNREPLYIVDTKEQVILVYEYSVQGEGLGFISSRSYKYDKQLEEYGRTFGPDIEKIKAQLLKTGR